MMKKILFGVLVVGLLSVTGCSDGKHASLALPNDNNLQIVPPEIILTIASTDDAATKGSSAAIEAGDSVLVEWEIVTTAKEADVSSSLVSEELGITLDKVAMKDQRVFDNITANAKFTLSVTIKDKPYTKEVTVSINEAPKVLEVSLTADPATIPAGESSRLCWTISEANASYKIEDDAGAAITSKEANAANAEVAGESDDCVIVRPEKTTIYTITATAEGMTSASKEATVTVEAAVTPPEETPPEVTPVTRIDAILGTDGDQMIFGGETAKIQWWVVDKASKDIADAIVLVKGGEFGDAGQTFTGRGSAEVKPTETTVYTIIATSPTANPPVPEQVKVVVRNWKGPGANAISMSADGATTNPATALGSSGLKTDVVYAGYDSMLGYKGADGKEVLGFQISMGAGEGPKWTEIKVPCFDVFPKIGNIGKNSKMFKTLKYPVNAISVDSSGKIFIATNGGVMYSKDNGSSWISLVAILLESGYTNPYRSCQGFDSTTWDDGTFSGLSQVCDVATTSTGRFIIATDTMVEYLPNGADAFIGSPKGNAWLFPTGFEVGTPIHDIEVATLMGGQEAVLLGTDKGILISMDNAETFATFGGSGAPTEAVYAVSVDPDSGKVYAGTSSGFYTCALKGYACTGWANQSVEGASVYAFAVDPMHKGAVFAATSKGVYYSMKGLEWRSVTLDPMPAGVVVRDVLSTVSEDGKRGMVYAATSEGVFVSSAEFAKVVDVEAATVTPEPTTTPEAVPTTTTDLATQIENFQHKTLDAVQSMSNLF